MLGFGRDGRRMLVWIWPALSVVVVAVFTLLVVRPFGKNPIPTGDDIAEGWSDSIGRLGLTAVFPPDEDIYVGDIFAVVSDEDKKSNLLG
jgi:hypothetical protein